MTVRNRIRRKDARILLVLAMFQFVFAQILVYQWIPGLSIRTVLLAVFELHRTLRYK